MIRTSKGYGKNATASHDLLVKDHNHRLRQNENKLSHILDGDSPLAEFGLQNPIVVLPLNEAGFHEIVRGHTRNMALAWLAENKPEAYAKWFVKGIPVEILPAGLSASEIETIRQDQGESQDLSHRAEFLTAAVEKMRRNDSEHKIIETLYRFFQRFGQQNADKDAEYDKLILAGDSAEARKVAHTRFHGAFQKLQRFYNLPPVFLLMYRAQAENRGLEAHEIPAWLPEVGNTLIPVWRDKYSKSLDDKWRNEQKVLDGTGMLPAYNRQNPGPEFIAYCKALIQEVEENAGKTSDKVVADKSLSSKALQDLAKDCGSRLMKEILLFAAGKDVPGFTIENADQFLQLAEAIRDEPRNVNRLLIDLQENVETDVNELTIFQIGGIVKENLKTIMAS